MLTEYLSWRWCLLVNVPIALIAVAGAIPIIKESKASGDTSYDIPGAITVTGGLVALVYALTTAAPHSIVDKAHWTQTSTLIWFAAALVLLVSFFVIENRTANPLLPMRVLLERNRGGSYLTSLIVGIGLFAMFLFLGLYLQVVLHYSPVKAGFAFLPFAVGIILTAGVAANLLPKVGPRPLMVPGLLLGAVGLLFLSQITPTSNYWTHVFPAMIMMSVGMALNFIPVASTSLHGVGGRDAGVASALINTSQQVGGSLGTALLNTVATTAATSFIVANGAHLGNRVTAYGLTHGYTEAFKVGAGFMVLAAIVVLALIRVGKDAVREDDEVPAMIG